MSPDLRLCNLYSQTLSRAQGIELPFALFFALDRCRENGATELTGPVHLSQKRSAEKPNIHWGSDIRFRSEYVDAITMLCRHQQKERTRRPVIPKLTAHARLRQPPCDPPDLCLTPVSGLPDARLLLWGFNRYTRSVSPTDEHNNIISESGHRVAAALIARVLKLYVRL